MSCAETESPFNVIRLLTEVRPLKPEFFEVTLDTFRSLTLHLWNLDTDFADQFCNEAQLPYLILSRKLLEKRKTEAF